MKLVIDVLLLGPRAVDLVQDAAVDGLQVS